jgi:hypothetical protein
MGLLGLHGEEDQEVGRRGEEDSQEGRPSAAVAFSMRFKDTCRSHSDQGNPTDTSR